MPVRSTAPTRDGSKASSLELEKLSLEVQKAEAQILEGAQELQAAKAEAGAATKVSAPTPCTHVFPVRR